MLSRVLEKRRHFTILCVNKNPAVDHLTPTPDISPRDIILHSPQPLVFAKETTETILLYLNIELHRSDNYVIPLVSCVMITVMAVVVTLYC